MKTGIENGDMPEQVFIIYRFYTLSMNNCNFNFNFIFLVLFTDCYSCTAMYSLCNPLAACKDNWKQLYKGWWQFIGVFINVINCFSKLIHLIEPIYFGKVLLTFDLLFRHVYFKKIIFVVWCVLIENLFCFRVWFKIKNCSHLNVAQFMDFHIILKVLFWEI